MHQTPEIKRGILYIVATPIGNLEDITLRALRILKEVDYIAAEDTRHTQKLLTHFSIQAQLISYYREKEHSRAETIVQLLDGGKRVALVTDAGTPGISDPGGIVVNLARENNHTIEPIPGVSAITAALSCSGIGEGSILFHGFPPAKKNQRRQILQTLTHTRHHTVFYESPHRLSDFLKDALTILGDRPLFMARELTKRYEELRKTTIGDLLAHTRKEKLRGEFVLIISPGEMHPDEDLDLDSLIRWYRDNSALSMKDCCKKLATDLGISKGMIYKKAITLWREDEADTP